MTRPARLLPLIFPVAVVGSLLLAPMRPGTASASGSPSGSFVNFESGQVRPLALSPDGTRLFAVNTPDDRLEIFDVGTSGLSHTGSVPVGLEPVAVAARSDDKVWVVNLLSDSVSIVDVSTNPPRVKRTLLTCDEPRDVVFAGPGGQRASQLGSGTMFCASAPAKEPAASNDTTEKFNGAKQTPPPADCPHVPGNG